MGGSVTGAMPEARITLTIRFWKAAARPCFLSRAGKAPYFAPV